MSRAGLEPAGLGATLFESAVSTDSTTGTNVATVRTKINMHVHDKGDKSGR